jgi:hypothetical protein
VASIEEIIEEKFNSEKDRLATKQDILALETRMEHGFKDQLKWLIVLMVGLSSLAIAVLKLT